MIIALKNFLVEQESCWNNRGIWSVGYFSEDGLKVLPVNGIIMLQKPPSPVRSFGAVASDKHSVGECILP